MKTGRMKMQNSDLINKRALISFIDKKVVPELLLNDDIAGAGVMAGLSKVLEEMNVFPEIDAVQVVRCRECKHYRDGKCEQITYIMDGYYRDTFEVKRPDDFCSRGERKEDDHAE